MDYYARDGSTPFLAPREGPTIFTSSDPTASLTMIRSHVCAIIICYLVGVFGLKVFYVVPILVLFWHHWRECYQVFVWVTRLRCEHYEVKKSVHRNTTESVQWINDIVKHWWTVCDQSITDFVKDWMEPIVSKFKLEHFVEYLKILTFNIGPHRSKFSNLQILQKVSKPRGSKDDVNVFIPITFDNLLRPPIVSTTEGKCTYAIEVDAELDVPSADFKMQAKLGGVNQKLMMNVESFHLSGRAQCVINIDRRAPFPHIATADVCFLPTPKLKVNCRTLKDFIELQATPLVKQIGEKYIERGFQRILVYPKKEHIDFTPTPPPGDEWSYLRGQSGLSQGVLTVKIEPLSAGNSTSQVKKLSFGNHFIKFTLGSQKCLCELHSIDDWSSTFSFLVHDCTTEKLTAKLKARHKIRQVSTIKKMEMLLASLGLVEDNSSDNEEITIDKKVQMSGGGIQFLFSLCYSPLPRISLTYPIPSLDKCSMEDSGVLYVHVHACRGISTRANKLPTRLYCIVRQGTDTILKTHTLSTGPLISYSWERGVELLIRSCRGLELTFEVLSDDGMLSSHDALGWTTLRLNMDQPQIIQNRLSLTCPMRKLSHPAQSPPMACIYVSVIYRNVKSVSLTCDSLQKAFMERTRQGSTASCLDQTTRFLNPTYQGYDVINVESSDDEEEIVTPTDHAHVNDCSSHVVSSPEDSLRLFSC